MDQEISVVLPAYYNLKEFKLSFANALNQSKPPKEIIIIDSSKDKSIQDFVENELNVGETKIIYEQSQEKLFPGAARNLGVSLASCKWIAFLDSKTVPNFNWLKMTLEKAISKNSYLIFGQTRYQALTRFQSILIDSTYGHNPIVTVPGTLVSKKIFTESGGFNPSIRSGEDLQWKDHISKGNIHFISCDEASLVYSSLPRNLYKACKKFFIYQMYGALVDIQINARSLFLAIFLIFITLVVPRWNSLLPGWDAHPLYLPNITKIYILSLTFLTMMLLIFNRSFFMKPKISLLARALRVVIFILSIIVVLRWNYVFADFVETSSLYIPHITKIYLSLIACLAICYRGIYFPLKHGVHIKNIFPLRWINIGLLGMILDIAKAPGYLLGAIWKMLKF